jgi:hypothetical protein
LKPDGFQPFLTMRSPITAGCIDSYMGGIERGEHSLTIETLMTGLEGLAITTSDLLASISSRSTVGLTLVYLFLYWVGSQDRRQAPSSEHP